VGALASLICDPLHSQTAVSKPDNADRVFQTNARIVVLNVVVTGKNNHPIQGLHKEDFRVSEDGHPQTVTSLEEHTGAQSLQANLPELPTNVFTNIPRIPASGSVTVLVLDSLNTPLDDQNNVRTQVLNYLRKLDPGSRTAIFALGTQLRLLQGFTDDPARLKAAVNNRKDGAGSQVSPLMQSDIETAVTLDTIDALMQHAPDAAANMQQFMAEEGSIRSNMRLKKTLEAFQQLAQYLGGLPGRKNVAWFSGAFPVVIFPDPTLPDEFGAERDDNDDVKKTDALLASAQVAIYPIAAEGVATDSVYNAATDTRLTSPKKLSRAPQAAQLRNANHAAMDQIARDTGGTALYGSNNLTDALNRMASLGSYFYTLTYTTTNQSADGRFRKIQVGLANPGYQLAYRRGYYADDAKRAATAAVKPDPNPLSPFLRPGLPQSTQIPFTVRVVGGSAPAKPAALPATGVHVAGVPGQGGDNPNLQGTLTRYAVDFMVPARDLQFETAPDSHRRVSLEVALVIYNSKGEALNWILRQVNLNLDAAQYAIAQSNNVNLFFEIDAPPDGPLLRTGVYDLTGKHAGTLEIPLSIVVAHASAAVPQGKTNSSGLAIDGSAKAVNHE
jgi:VWFA-related protein